MKHWQMRLMIVVLLSLPLPAFVGFGGLFLVPIIWFLGRKVANSAAGEGPLKAAVRFVIAGLAAVGFSVVIVATQAVWLRFFPGMLGPMFFIPLSCLLIYWLEETYALVPLEGVGRTILRAVVSLILASFVAIGFGIVFVVSSFLAHPVEGPVNFGWTGWVLLSLSFVLSFDATWKLLPQNDHR